MVHRDVPPGRDFPRSGPDVAAQATAGIMGVNRARAVSRFERGTRGILAFLYTALLAELAAARIAYGG